VKRTPPCDEVPPAQGGSHGRQWESSQQQPPRPAGQEDHRVSNANRRVAVKLTRDSIALNGLGEIPGQQPDRIDRKRIHNTSEEGKRQHPHAAVQVGSR
jgi:hypothetical protein